jgi:hypothetical protein
MTVKRLYFLLIAILGLLFVGLIGGTYGANTLFQSQADKLLALKAESTALNQEQLTLKNDREDISKYSNLEQIAQAIVPEDKDQAQTVLEIVNLASQYGIGLASITFPASTLGTSTGDTKTTTGGTTTIVQSPSASSPTSPTNSLSQLEVVPNIPGVYQLLITVQGDPNNPVHYSNFINFLNALEYNRRTALINGITLEPASNNANLLTFTLTLDEYIKP